MKAHRSTWSRTEPGRLRILFYQGKTDAEIASMLERSPVAVRNKRIEMGLFRQPGTAAAEKRAYYVPKQKTPEQIAAIYDKHGGY